MLDGINVLNEYFIMKEFPPFLFFAPLVCLIVGILIASLGAKLEFTPLVVVGILVIFLTLLPLSLGINVSNQPSDIKEYQVTIDNSVSMVDFTSKYDIIRVDGEIYTIREKDGE